jgi:hypothetical protein
MRTLLRLLISVTIVFAEPQECLLVATQPFSIRVSLTSTATIEVNQGQLFTGKIYPDVAKVKIGDLWYPVSRNYVILKDWNPNAIPH